MNKKVITVIIVIAVLLVGFISYKILTKEGSNMDNEPTMNKGIFEFEEYEGLDVQNVVKLEINKYTEGGNIPREIEDHDEILSTYNDLFRIRLIKECDMACEDNTTVYIFTMKDGKQYKVEKECDWFIIGNKRYYYEKK